VFRDLFRGQGVCEAPSDPRALGRRAFFGTIALSAVSSGRLALQMLVLPVIARLLGPEDYGLVSLAMPFILFANLLSDAGMGAALVRRADPSPALESTVFWLCVMIGLGIAVCVSLLAAPASWLFHEPRVAPLMLALCPILVLSSCLSVANARISRARHFALFAIGDLISVSLSSGAAILAALHGWGPWSLVVQQLTLWLAKATWVLGASRFRPRLTCDLALAKGLLSFGLNNVGANVADFTGKSAPALVIGALLGVMAVGRFSMATQLIRIPDLVFSGPFYLATFAAVSRLSGAEAGKTSARALRMVVSVLAPIFCGLGVVADLVVRLFLGPRWQGAAETLAILAPGGIFVGFYSVASAVLMGLGRADRQFRLSLACGVSIFAGALAGAHSSLEGAAAGVTIGAAIISPFYIAVLASELRISAARLVADVARPLAASAIMVCAVLLTRSLLVGGEAWLQLLASLGAGAATFVAVLCVTSGRQLVDDVRQTLPTRARERPSLT